MRVSWRNLDWVSQEERAEIERQLRSWSRGDRGLDGVELVGIKGVPDSGGPRAGSVVHRTRIAARVGKAQITVVRDAASEADAFALAFSALESSARWALDRPQEPVRRGLAAGPDRMHARSEGGDEGASVWQRFSLPRFELPTLSLPSLVPAGVARWRAARAEERRANAARSRRRAAGTRSAPRARRGRTRQRQGSWRRRMAATAAGLAILGVSSVDPESWIELRIMDPLPIGQPLAFTATATANASALSSTSRVEGAVSGFRAVATADMAFRFSRERGAVQRGLVGARSGMTPTMGSVSTGSMAIGSEGEDEPSAYRAVAGQGMGESSSFRDLSTLTAGSR